MVLELPTLSEILERRKPKECFSTGSIWLDLNIEQQDQAGRFGVPARTICMASGFPRSGKTLLGESLALSVLNQDPENEVILLLAEEPNFDRLVNKGFDIERTRIWSFCQDPKFLEKHPDLYITAETGLDQIIEYIRKGRRPVKWGKDPKTGKDVPTEFKVVRYVMIDSVSALVSENDLYSGNKEKSVADEPKTATRAHLVKKFLLKWEGANHSDAILFLTGHKTVDIHMPNQQYVPKVFNMVSSGGSFQSFSSYLQIECYAAPLFCEAKSPISDVQEINGMELTYRVITNKHCTSTLGRTAVLQFIFEEMAFKKSREIFKIAVGIDLLPCSGPWYTVDNDAAGNPIKVQGEPQVLEYLDEHPELMDKLEKLIFENKDKLFPKSKVTKIRNLKAAGKLNIKESK